jgi:hypothetical protein
VVEGTYKVEEGTYKVNKVEGRIVKEEAIIAMLGELDRY